MTPAANDNGGSQSQAPLISIYGARTLLYRSKGPRDWFLARILIGPNGAAVGDRLFAALPHPASPKVKPAVPAPNQSTTKSKRPAFIRGVVSGDTP